MPLAQVWTSSPTNFSFQNHFFNSIKILMIKITQNSISLHLRSKKFQIGFINSYSPSAFQQYWEVCPNKFPYNFFFILLNFQWKNCFSFNPPKGHARCFRSTISKPGNVWSMGIVTPKKKIPNGHHGHSSKAKKNPQKWNNHICKQSLIKVHWKLEWNTKRKKQK
jgi:fatty-acid desaturase